MKKGFTLIELLVVVLIIGILSAIALPQYQKAVEKSRAMQGLSLVKTIGQAADMYYLANDTMPSTFSELDVQLPADYTGTSCFMGSGGCVDSHSNGKWAISMENNLNEGGAKAIHIGQITGDYTGAGFSYYIGNHGNFKAHHLYCVEKMDTYGGILFDKADGAFCQKMFNGVLIHASGIRGYEMP